MQSSLYVSLSGLMATDRRLTTVANNIANAATPGFRAEEVRFEEVMAKAGSNSVSFSSAGETFISTKAGPVNRTDNSLDFAIAGEAWFSVQTPSGVAYTRDGRFEMTPEGALRTVVGHAVLDAAGAPLAVAPDGGPITVGRDGSITQNNVPVGAFALFMLPPDAKLTRAGSSGVQSDKPAIPVIDFTVTGVLQGFSEGSNVNPTLELTKLISLQRNFESSMSGTREVEETLMSAIRSLGPNT